MHQKMKVFLLLILHSLTIMPYIAEMITESTAHIDNNDACISDTCSSSDEESPVHEVDMIIDEVGFHC